MHPKVAGGRAAIVSDAEPVEGTVGVKTMLGIGGITACVVMRGAK
jgi:hypothetical protein